MLRKEEVTMGVGRNMVLKRTVFEIAVLILVMESIKLNMGYPLTSIDKYITSSLN
jgi:hypothetical protein